MYVKDAEDIKWGLERHAEQYVVFDLDVDSIACHSSDYLDGDGNTLTDIIFGPNCIEMLQEIQGGLTEAALQIFKDMANKYMSG